MRKGIEGLYIKSHHKEILYSIKYCKYCGSSENLSIDHILPVNKGGKSNIENLTRACKRCNSYKSDFTLCQFQDRFIEKRIIVYKSTIGHLYRLKNARRRHSECDEAPHIREIQKGRVLHTYFTKVLESIKSSAYKL